MPVRNHKQLQIEQERANGRAVGRMAKRFNRDIDPLMAAIRKAKSPEGLKRALGPTLLKRMGTDATAEAIGVETLKAALAGVASGTPKRQETGDKKLETRN